MGRWAGRCLGYADECAMSRIHGRRKIFLHVLEVRIRDNAQEVIWLCGRIAGGAL